MRDIDLGGIYVPAILIIFLVVMAAAGWLDRLLAKTEIYEHVWHPALLRVSLFVCIFGAAVLYFHH